jgi:hypothetical protein
MHKECFPEQGWVILNSLKDMVIEHKAILAGGTACALHLGHRISMDLDFFTGMDFQIESVISEIRKAGHSFQIISEGEGYLVGNIDGIKVSLFKYEYPFLGKSIVYEGIPVAGVLDIASMKVIAISQRGTKRDFADIYCILQEMPFHNIADHMVKRFGKGRINPVHVGKSLVYFSDADSNPEPEYVKGRDVSWEKIKSFFRNHVRQYVLDLDAAVKAGSKS